MAIRAPDGAKNGHILPTGQWYAPSAVINDAWYCMVLHGIALYCIKMQIPDIFHFFTQTKFLKNKIYTEKRQFFAFNL